MPESASRIARPPWSRIVFVALAVLVIVSVMEWWSDDRGEMHAVPEAVQGAALPELFLERLDAAGTFDLGELRGGMVLVDFWSVDCRPCRESRPWLASVARRLSQDGLQALSVNTDMQPARARAYVERAAWAGPVVLDEGILGRLFGVRVVPTVLLLDREGRPLAYWRGLPPQRVFESQLRAALRP